MAAGITKRRSRHQEPAVAPSSGLSPPALLVVAALTTAVVAQGAFYQPAQRVVAAVLAVAFVAGISRPSVRRRHVHPAVVTGGLLAGWAVVSAGLAGDVGRATGVVGLLAGMAVIAMVASRGDAAERRMLATAAIVIGALLALAGWAGVAWHLTPLALVDQGLWRAAGTITYANAAAGLLAPLGLLGLAALVERPSPQRAGVACLLLVGLGATLSRGGFIAFVVGAVVLAHAVGWRRLLPATVGPLLGSAVALAALAPSVPVSGPARPVLAVGGFVLGVVLAARVDARGVRPTVALALAVLVSAAAIAAISGAGRLTLASPDRVGEARAALSLAAERPIAGVGPGWRSFAWTDADGFRRVAEYAHNEYLQVLAELGVVGLALLAGLLAAVGGIARHGRRAAPSTEIWAGVAGGLVAVAVHAASDFSWHVPAVPLTGALLVGIVMQPRPKESTP
jgi:O-antigen ligase